MSRRLRRLSKTRLKSVRYIVDKRVSRYLRLRYLSSFPEIQNQIDTKISTITSYIPYKTENVEVEGAANFHTRVEE